MKKILSLAFLAIFLFSCEKDDDEIQEKKDPEELLMEVNNVFPLKVDLGDTVSVTGRNFRRDASLSLNDNQLPLIFNNDSVLKFRVPYSGFNPANFEIKVNSGSSPTEILKNPFALYAPVIDSIPSNFGFREQVVIYGKHLTNPPNQLYDIIYLNNKPIEAINQSKDSIVFQLPYLQTHENDLLIKAQLQEVRMAGGVKIAPPVIHKVSATKVKVGQEITIHGAFFLPYSEDAHEVYFNNNRAEIKEAHQDSLIVKLPLGPYESREISELRIKIFDKEVSKTIDLHIENIWYLYGYKRDWEISNTAGVGSISPWSFQNDEGAYFNVYRTSGSSEIFNNVLYKYTAKTNSWKELPPIPIEVDEIHWGNLLHLFPFKDGEHLYIYVNRPKGNFFKYNLLTGELSPLQDFPNTEDEILNEASGFFSGNQFYFGLGYIRQTYSSKANTKIWKYNENTDSWEEASEMPESDTEYVLYGPTIFERNNKVYIGNGNDRIYDFWEFSPDETWTRKSDIPNPSSNTMNVQLGDSAFYYDYLSGFFREYDFNKDQWQERRELEPEGYNLGEETMFIEGDYVYIVGYQAGYPLDGSAFFNGDHIILRTELSNFE